MGTVVVSTKGRFDVTKLTLDETLIYNRALENAYFYVPPGAGCLRLGGETRVDFLQRQTTNDLRLLSPDGALVTVLTSPQARILDVLLLVDEGDSILMLTLPGRAASTGQFLQSRIFFMDKVTVTAVRDEWVQILLGGGNCDAVLDVLSVDPPMDVGDVARQRVGSGVVEVIRVGSPHMGEYLILADPNAGLALTATLREVGVVELNQSVHEVLRIENGMPAGNAELTEDYTPLEVGLQSAVANSKGCYTGQEVIARQLTYDKVVQRLVGLTLRAAASPGAPLSAGGRQVGVITSTAQSPRYGSIGLGYVRRPDHEVGTILHLGPGEGGNEAVICPLPFGTQ